MSDNEYLAQVMENQRRVQGDLKARRSPIVAAKRSKGGFAVMAPRAAAPMQEMAAEGSGSVRAALGGHASPEPEQTSSAVDVRVTGWWRWKTVIVPPNAHVVHTRRGHDRPVHIGLGTSFRYNPATDSFLVVPGTMQTILINAQCICRELQGLFVQGYVQWIVADFATAYRQLDFTDVDDPMRVVNVQLREQAEAAIKDKVATMTIDDVLSDKQPIIEELTARLRAVAEGAGLRIITVQVKEAVVSSRAVWESLQRPFRSERARVARLAELETETEIAERETNAERSEETRKLDTEAELAALRAKHEAAVFDRDQAEALRRKQTASEMFKAEAELARTRAAEHAAARQLEVERALTVNDLERAAANRQAKVDVELLEATQRVTNSLSAEALQARLIELLPAIADKLPRPNELKSITIGGTGAGNETAGLTSLIAQLMAIVDGIKEPSGSVL